MRIRPHVLSVSLAFAVAATPVLLGLKAQDTYTLRLNPGEATYKQTAVSKASQVVSGMADVSMTINSTLGQTMKFAKADKSTQITVTTEEAKIEMDSTEVIDSEAASTAIKAIVVKITADARGKVEKNEVTGGTPESLGNQAFENAIKSGWNGITLPESPVKIGSKWTDEVDPTKNEQPADSTIKVTSGTLKFDHELVAVEEIDGVKCAKIHVTVKGTLKGEVNAGVPMEATIVIDTTSDYWIDLATGVHAKNVTKGKYNVDLGMIQVAVDQETTITAKKS